MRKIKIAINTEKAVKLIRSAASDVLIMETFRISAAELQKLFKKLVDAHEISQAELDRRMLASGRSHVIDLTDKPVARAPKTLINADEAADDVRSGMSDIGLMEKYNLSVKGLDSLLSRLLDTGKVARSQLNQRKKIDEWGDGEGLAGRDRHYMPPEDEPEGGNGETAGSYLLFFQKHRLLLAALAGAVTGMAVLAFVLLLVGFDGIPARRAATIHESPYGNAADAGFARQVEETITVLESVTRDRAVSEKSGDGSEQPALQACLEECKNSHGNMDDPEKTLLIACRKECLYNHSELFKSIRRRYHGSQE
jgi:hypothetical protein